MESNHKRIRVLMIGPGQGTIGGISALVETLLPDLAQQVDLQYLPTAQGRPARESGKVSVRNVVLAVSQYARFLRARHCFHPDIIHLHTSQGIGWLKDTFFVLTAKAYGCHVVLHLHAAEWDELYGKRAHSVQWYTRQVMSLADAVIAVSESWRSELARVLHTDRVFAFRNCIAIDAVHPERSCRRANGATALFLGSVGARKGAFDLLEVMSYLKLEGCSLRLWIAGDGERKEDLARARARLAELDIGKTCQLVGTVRGAEKARLLSEASLFVLPSHNEGLPIAVLEALAAGLAIVATPVGGIPEVVKDGHNGFLVPPGDVSALAKKMAILASNADLRQLMGERSREIAERELDVKPYVKRLVTLYESLVGPGRNAQELL